MPAWDEQRAQEGGTTASGVPPCPALPRRRLDELLGRLWEHGFALVVAPAGSGKTTLLSQFVANTAVPTAFCRVEAVDGSESALLARLERSCSEALGVPGGWRSPDDALAALRNWQGERAAVVLDDLHTIEGTPGETMLGRLVGELPSSVAVLAATRRPPTFDLSLRRLSGRLLELDADRLRFRYWEVEELFRDFYREPLPPEDLAQLARCTGGWAAALQLFHLATMGKPPADRRRFLSGLGTRSPLVREYLTRNLLGELPFELRRFLLETSVLDQLDGRRCDALLARTGSAALLEELERRQIVTFVLGEDAFRSHEVLRGHLEAVLFDEAGEAAARELYLRAGRLLEAEGALTEALRAYCRADDWGSAALMLDRAGETLAADPGSWVEQLPPAVVEGDPWLLLALARRHLSGGHWRAALEAYTRAEQAFGAASGAALCRRERAALGAWTDPALGPPSGWAGVLLAALRRDPIAGLATATAASGPHGLLVAGACAQLAGQRAEAERLLADAAEDPHASASVVALADLLAALPLADLVTGAHLPDRDVVLAAAEVAAGSWVTRLARAVLALSGGPEGAAEAHWVRRACEREGDRWGAALAVLFEGLALLRQGEASRATLADARQRFHALGAGTLEAWSQSAVAVAARREGHEDADAAAISAERFARLTAVRGAQTLALDVLDTVTTSSGPAMAPPSPPRVGGNHAGADGHPLTVRCFGGFDLWMSGRRVDLSSVKPKARVLLRILAVAAGRPVHREQLVDALWPNIPMRAACHNLHVAVSALRQALEPGARRGDAVLLRREGDAYRLALPEGADVDVQRFEQHLADARSARAAGAGEAAAAALERALLAYAGELLPEDGPADWVVAERDRMRQEAAGAAETLAEMAADRGDAAQVVATCETGLRIDPYRDRLWRHLVTAHIQSGDLAVAERASRAYRATLDELGVAPR